MRKEGVKEDNSSDGDGYMNEEELTGSDEDESEDDEDEDIATEGNNGKLAKKEKNAHSAPDAKTKRKRQDAMPQDGVYTAEVYKSNMFKLQLDELLEQVKPKYGKKEASAERAMRTLKTLIEQIPSRGPLSIPEAEKLFKSSKIAIPFPKPLPPKDAKYKLQFERPASVNATGSYPLKISTRTNEELVIDMVVTMPGSIFQEKDYLNYRYFYKRAFYLACIVDGLMSSKDHKFKISYDCLNGNYLQPIIIVRPSGDGSADDFSSAKCRIQILLAAPDKTFPDNKLRPNSNCVRPKVSEEESTKEKVSPTPFYNATVQSDSSVTAYLKLLHSSSSNCDSYKDACILGRVWLRQRGFSSRLRKGGFGNFEWAAMIALLLQSNHGAGPSPLSPGYSSYQLFKATLQFLANKDLLKTPYLFQASDVQAPKHDSAPFFFDGPRNLNILYKMTPWSYARLRHEAKLTVQMLGETGFDQFEPTFILKVDSPVLRYEAVVEIPVASLGFNPTSDEYDQSLIQTARKMYTTLARALTDRVTSISINLPAEKNWSVMSTRPQENGGNIVVSIACDPANANRAVDHGPAAENKKEAAAYRQFWGEKAELRRFKDGSILESVVWSAKDTKSPILEQIVSFILRRHFGSQVGDQMRVSGDSFAHMISSGRIAGQSGVVPFVPLMNAFAALEKDIRNLEGLPLQIRHFFAADPQLRYTSVNLPTSTVQSLMHTPASIVIQFEGSGRWPDDLSAIQRTKIAFLLKIGELLSTYRSTYTTRIGLENQSQPSQNQAYLEIILPSGPSFRLRIHHDREAALLERQLKDKSLDGISRESAALALAAYKRNYLRVPSHTQTVQTLCTRFPALSPSIRVTKKWFSSHLLSPHFAPEFIELLVIRTFLQPHPWPVPACATTGFLRTLAWISRWDWRHVPLIVDLGSSGPEGADSKANAMKSEEINKIRTRFEAWRKIDPALNRVVLFAATNNDVEGTTWTDGAKPEKVVAARMTALARASMNVLKQEEDRLASLLEGGAEGEKKQPAFVPDSLFISNLQDYDFLLHVSPDFARSNKRLPKSKFKNLEIQQSIQANNDVQSVAYDPVETYATELRAVYGDSILWFWDSESLDVIAGLWNPTMTGQRAWKIKAGWNSLPLVSSKNKKNRNEEEKAEIKLNKEATLNEIARLGSGLLERIEMK
ncbi:Nrap protein [Delitschia confertaspora ATCC 74209]|uniref:U3 small nucleolar RNA-associated protein 22 n=1 Tax=Delitschia confertaspora ATCC 74209 TaxID=1513339 RepID=A0A9P4JIE5_9PLEO|nr:Nrap protein [Delitschia confertaspora ATCC 74209]